MLCDCYPGTWWISTGSWSFRDKGGCIIVANEHGKCCLASWYMFSICSSHSLYSENLQFLYFISLFVFQFLCMSNWKWEERLVLWNLSKLLCLNSELEASCFILGKGKKKCSMLLNRDDRWKFKAVYVNSDYWVKCQTSIFKIM